MIAMWCWSSEYKSFLDPLEKLHEVGLLRQELDHLKAPSLILLYFSRIVGQHREGTLGRHEFFVLLKSGFRCRSHINFVMRGPSPPLRSWPACERLFVVPRSAVETALVVVEELVPDQRPCPHSSLSISFTTLCHQTNERASPKVSSATMHDDTTNDRSFLEPNINTKSKCMC